MINKNKNNHFLPGVIFPLLVVLFLFVHRSQAEANRINFTKQVFLTESVKETPNIEPVLQKTIPQIISVEAFKNFNGSVNTFQSYKSVFENILADIEIKLSSDNNSKDSQIEMIRFYYQIVTPVPVR